MDKSENSNDCVSKNAPEARLKSQQKQPSKSKRLGERGNVFFALFGAVAVVGVLGAGIMSTMRGPLSTMVNVNRLEQAKAEVRLAASLVLAASTDDDADGYKEGVDPTAVGTFPAGVGAIPSSVSAPKTDPWGNLYGYCAWDLGTSFVGYDNLLAGSDDQNDIAIAIISAGPDGEFDTTCVADNAGTTDYVEPDNGGNDDIVESRTYTESIAGSGGLWTPDAVTDEATIAKDLNVTGGAIFSGNINLREEIASIMLPTQAEMADGDCNAANDGLMRLNTTGTDYSNYTLELCENGTGWVPASAAGVWENGTGDDIYYDTGSPQVGIGTDSPTETLHVDGTALITGTVAINDTVEIDGDVQINADVDITGATAIDGTLEVAGTSTLADLDADATTTTTLDASGNTTVGGTLVVTGTSTLADLDADATTTTTLAASGNTTVGGTLEVAGTSNLQGNISNSTGDVIIDDTLTVKNDLEVVGGADFTGDVTIASELSVDDDARFSADIIVQTSDSLIPMTCEADSKILHWDSTGGWQCDDIAITGDDIDLSTLSLSDLADTDIAASPSTDDCLIYTTANKWENEPCEDIAGGIWEDAGTVVRIADTAGYASDDFVFGSPQLDDDGTASHDARFFFDKSKGAFRAGVTTGSRWDDAFVGNYSVAMSLNAQASGDSSVALGYLNSALGANSFAAGYSTTASGTASHAQGFITTASGAASTAMGNKTNATGDNSAAIGLGNASTASYPTVSGVSSLGIFMGDQSAYDLSDSNIMALIGGTFLIDDDGTDTAGTNACLRYNSTDSVLEYSDDCSTWLSFTNDIAGLWTDLGGDSIHYGADDTVKVGVGTSNPQVTLDVGGTLRVGSVTGFAPIFYSIDSLSDITITSPTEEQCLSYDSVNSTWINTDCKTWEVGATAGEIYYNAGNVGVGTAIDPAVSMDIGGTLRVANGGEACDSTVEGAIRYNSSALEYCNGTSWRSIASSTSGVSLSFNRTTEAGMDIDGATCGATPCTGTAETFILSNIGATTSDILSVFTFTGNTDNFNISENTCTGVALAPASNCQITIEPVASTNESYSARMIVDHHSSPQFTIGGTAANFGCIAGTVSNGGTVVECNYSGEGHHLIINDSGCDGTTNNPTCSGIDTSAIARTWASSSYNDQLFMTDGNNGAQNHANLIAYSAGMASAYPAAQYCDDLIHNGQSDWFLPAHLEFVNACTTLGAAAGLRVNEYSVSNESTSTQNRIQTRDGSDCSTASSNSNHKTSAYTVRCMRIEGVDLPTADVDNTPDDFSFTTSFANSAGVTTTSSTVTLTGLTPDTAISISGSTAEYSINGGTYTSSAGTVAWGDTVSVRIDSGAIGTNAQATLTIGTVSSIFTVVTTGDCGGSCAGIDKRVFVSSTTGISAGRDALVTDADCQGYADAASLGGSWISLRSNEPEADWIVNRMDYNWDRLVNMDGETIATSPEDLWDGSIANFIDVDENGTTITSSNIVTTRSFANGTYRSNGYGRNRETNDDWFAVGSSGASGRIYCAEVTKGDVTLTSSPSTGAGIDVTGPGTPALGTETLFTITNDGGGISGTLSTSISNPTNFQITTDTCTGNTLIGGATCSMGITPQASADGTYFGTLIVLDSTNNVQADIGLSGTASNFDDTFAHWFEATTPGDIFYDDGNVGIGTDTPVTTLDIEGAIQLSDNGETCSSAADIGGIRFSGTQFEICQSNAKGWEGLAIVSSCNATETISTAGTHSYQVPETFDTLTIKIWGGGGGGGFNNADSGSSGASTTINSLSLSAGGGGGGASSNAGGAGGTGGIASGGDINIDGVTADDGTNGVSSTSGGTAPNGGAGGAASSCLNGGNTGSGGIMAGQTPGGGGGSCDSATGAGGGGSGAYVEKTYTPAELSGGSLIADIVVGAAGSRGNNGNFGAGRGGDGQVSIICTDSAGLGINLTDLDDTPANYTGAANSVVKVNNAGDALEFASTATDAILLPAGTLLEQPAAPLEGMIRYNTDSDIFEGYVDDGTPDWEAINTGAGGKWLDSTTSGDIYYDIGAVGIGTDTPDADGLHIDTGGVLIRATNGSNAQRFTVDASSGYGILRLFTGAQTTGVLLSSDSNSYIKKNLGLGGNSSPDVALDVTGDIEYTGTITDVSDRRLKTDIAPLSQNGNILERISQIDTYSFVMKDDADKRTEFGVMAQELEPIFPELVHTADDEMGTKSVNYIGLIAPMIEGMKELRAENDTLKAELAKTNAALEGIDAQVKLLSKISAANTVDEGSMQYMFILLFGLMLGAGGMLVLSRKNHKA